MADTPHDTNGRITLAVLNANVLHLTNEIAAMRTELCAKLNDHEARIRQTEKWSGTSEERWRRHEEDHEALGTKNLFLDILGSVAAAIAGIVISKP